MTDDEPDPARRFIASARAAAARMDDPEMSDDAGLLAAHAEATKDGPVWPSTAAQHAVLLDQIRELEGEAECLRRLRGVIDSCRDAAGLTPSPDGPTGDVRNLLHRGDVAGREAQAYVAENMSAITPSPDNYEYVIHARITVTGENTTWERVASELAGSLTRRGGHRLSVGAGPNNLLMHISRCEIDTPDDTAQPEG